MLHNAPILAIVAVHTAENGPFLFFNLNPAPVFLSTPPLALRSMRFRMQSTGRCRTQNTRRCRMQSTGMCFAFCTMKLLSRKAQLGS